MKADAAGTEAGDSPDSTAGWQRGCLSVSPCVAPSLTRMRLKKGKRSRDSEEKLRVKRSTLDLEAS